MDSSFTMRKMTERLSTKNEAPPCEWCAPINLVNLEKTEPDVLVLLFSIQDLSQALTSRHCPTCQILQTVLNVHRSQYKSASVWWRRAVPGLGFMGTVEFQYTTGHDYKTLKPDLTIYDGMATPRRLKIQYAPRRINFELAKTWVAACKESHPACTTRLSRELKGLRVIDCVTRNVVAAPEECIYVALSYVWGMSGICDYPSSYTLPERLPLTVENSIDATLMLGYRYLWVDRYCIDQMNAADKHHQINQMGDIYSSAELTLIATAGANSAHGLPGVVSERERFENDVAIGRLRFVTTYGWAIDEIYRSVWSSRAWTFQEGYMSRRRLYFTDTRLVYICETEVYCDAEWGSMPTGRESLAHLAECLPSIYSKMGLAAGILREYTRRNLTFNSDALNAIVGILNTLSKGRTPIFHTWGVTFGKIPITKTVAQSQNLTQVPLIRTQNKLAIALHWVHTSPCPRRKEFPSWSPLGWEGVVSYVDLLPPVISTSFNVNLWDDGEFVHISKARETTLRQSHPDSLDKSRHLEITTKLGWLEVRYFSPSELLSVQESTSTADLDYGLRPGYHVRVPVGDDAEVYVDAMPWWDLEADPLLGSTRMPCAIIPVGHREVVTTHEIHVVREIQRKLVLMLRNHGTHYERIGCFEYPFTYWNNRTIFKAEKGTLTSREGWNMDYNSDETLARVFNEPKMQTFLLG